MTNTVSFTAPMNASAEQVQELFNAISDFFGHNPNAAQGTPSLPQQTAVVTQTAPASTDTIQPLQPGEFVDKNGLPYREQMHAKSKSINADGTYRKAKGLDEAVFNALASQVLGRPYPSAAATAPATTTIAAPSLPTQQPALGLPSLPPANTTPAVPGLAELIDFAAANMAPTGRITNDWLSQVIGAYTNNQATTLPDLAKFPDVVPTVDKFIRDSVAS
jgi:hypothetical protein